MRKLRRFLCGRLFPFALCTLFLVGGLLFLLIRLPHALAPIAAAERLFSLAVGLAVAGDPSPDAFRLSKLFLLLALPYAGAILCLLLRVPAFPPIENAVAEGEGLFSRVRTLCLSSGISPCASGEIAYFPTGEAMRERLLVDLAKAKRRIWLEYYIVSEGKFFSEIEAILKRKAEAGVDVRLLYDGFGCGSFPRALRKRLRGEGIAVRCFAPLTFPTRRSGRRNHRKIAVADGVAYTGGVNIADEYIGAKIVRGHWKDTAVRVSGSAADRLAGLFSLDWDGTPLAEEAAKGEIPCAVVGDTARDETRLGAALFPLLVSSAQKTLFCNTPYLAPDEPLFRALEGVARAGCDVRIMIPHLPDKKLPFFVSRAYARRLMRSGVKVREYTAGFLHAKSLVFDGKFCFVGSYNLDYRSLYLQAECGVFAEDKGLAGRLGADFLSAWETGTPLPPPHPAGKLFEGILRLIAPLM